MKEITQFFDKIGPSLKITPMKSYFYVLNTMHKISRKLNV